MIKATELRIGNKLRNGTSGGAYTVSMIEESGTIWFAEMDGHSYDLEDNDIGGIPISPDSLEKCGFYDNNKPGVYNLYIGALEKISFSVVDPFISYIAHDRFLREFRNILYLHQLQNLFYILTGEELNVQL